MNWKQAVGERGVALGASTLTLVFYLATTAGYGYFRDELYYLACGEHLGWGYVDHPPFIALVAWSLQHTIGTSLFALRLLPGVAAAVTVYLSCRLAQVFGGTTFAEILAAMAVAGAPVYLALFSFLSMNAFDVLFWTTIVFLSARILSGADRRLWLLVGIVAGIGAENKVSVLFLGFGLVAGLVIARRWREFASPWLWAGGAAAAAIFAPHVAWQMAYGWPTLEFIHNAQRFKIAALSVPGYLLQVTLQMQPVAAPMWLAGLWFLLADRHGRSWRPLGWTFLGVLALMLVERSKPYYVSPAYPMLFAAGAVVVARATAGRTWLRVTAIVLLAGVSALVAPLIKPLLPIDTLVAYQSRLHISVPSSERGAAARTTQTFADQFGWPEMVQAVARVYDALPAEDRVRACIGASNYGEAGAIDFFGPAYGLPKAISGHNSYFLWGPHGCDGSVVVLVGDSPARAEEMFEQVTLGATLDCRDCMPYEAHAQIWVCRRFRGGNLVQAWARAKSYI